LTLNGGTRPEPLTRFDSIYLLGNFVNVQGIDWPDGSGRFAVHWKTGEAFQPDYHVTGQLFTADGERVGQADIPVFPPDQWRPDDIVVSVFEPELTVDLSTAEKLTFGMYVYPSGEAVPVLDAAANPAGDFVELEIP
ncbi:MAG: hypothetical protein AAGD96_33095, partial [Chloroflexota bacterium]